MTGRGEANRYREPGTGRFAYWDDFERLCKCGHTLGVHIAGGFECGADAKGNNEPEAEGCKCQKFRPSGKRRAALAETVTPSKEGNMRASDLDKMMEEHLRRMAEPEPYRSLRLQKERIDAERAAEAEASYYGIATDSLRDEIRRLGHKPVA